MFWENVNMLRIVEDNTQEETLLSSLLWKGGYYSIPWDLFYPIIFLKRSMAFS